MGKVFHAWSENEKEYLFEITPGRHHKEIQELINKKFNLNLNVNQISSAIRRNKLKTGFTGCFEKGNVPSNKGVKGIWAKGCEKAWFKKGNIPFNKVSVGTERINGCGYVDVKVAEPNKWKAKHVLIWEKENGIVPKHHVVIFGDSDKRNFDINNLILITRAQLGIMNRNRLIKNDADLTRAGIIIADIQRKINQISRKS